VESTKKLTNRIGERRESERTEPRMGFPFLRAWGRPALFFQSQRLKVGVSTARWDFVVTPSVDSFQICCLVKIAHYANEFRPEHRPISPVVESWKRS